MSVTLTVAANAAVQFLGALDSGEGLSTQQVADALIAANNVLSNLTNEQTLAFQILIAEQTKALAAFVDQQSVEGAPLAARQGKQGLVKVDELTWEGNALAVAYTLAGGTYTPATYTAPSYNAPSFTTPSFAPGTVPQFADATTPLTLPAGWYRALNLELAIELAPQYDVAPSASLLKQAAEARAAANPVPNRTPIPGTSGQAVVPEPQSTEAMPQAR